MTASRSTVARDLHDEDEPAADVPAAVRAGQAEPVLCGQRRERLAVGRGDVRAVGQHAAEALQLRKPQRRLKLCEPVVEAQAIVVEPVHVRRAALVSLGVDLDLHVGVAQRDHSALARRQLLVRVEAEDRRVPPRADGLTVGVDGAECLAGILDDRQPELLERRDVGGVAEDVDRKQRRRAVGDRGGRGGRVEVQRDRIDVGEDGRGPFVGDDVRTRDEREGRRDDLVAVTDAHRAQREVQPRGARRDRARAVRADERREARSKAGIWSPSERTPERRTSSTRCSSSAPSTGWAIGIGSSLTCTRAGCSA